MRKDQIIAAIINRCGQRTDLDGFIETELDLQQSTTLERSGRLIPWFLETEVATSVTTIGDERLPVPADFVREKEEGGLFLYDATQENPYQLLQKKDYDDLVVTLGEQSGKPQYYSLGGEYFRLRYIPDAEYQMKMIYWQADTPPSAIASNQYNKWMRYAPDLLIAQVSLTIASVYMQDFDLAKTLEKPLQFAWERLFIETEAHAHVNRDYNKGD